MKISRLFQSLINSKDLSQKTAETIFEGLFSGAVSRAEAKALLLLLAAKGESPGEVAGCLNALRRHEPECAVSGIPQMMDTCGTGGDSSKTLNISTLAAFVIAGAGGKVAKHGNRALSSRCGSSDLLEALGVRLETPCKNMVDAIRQTGMGYFHAPLYHPVFAKMQPLDRKSTRLNSSH